MPNILEYARLANDVYATRPEGASGYLPLRISTLERDYFFRAVAYERNLTEPIVIAIRGSTTRQDWADADADIALGYLPVQYVGAAFSFFNAVAQSGVMGMAERLRRVAVVGHSLGGGLAAIVASRVTTRPVIGVTFNAPATENLRHVGQFVEADPNDLQTGSPVALIRGIVSKKMAGATSALAGVSSSADINVPVRTTYPIWNIRSRFDVVSRLRPPLRGVTDFVRIFDDQGADFRQIVGAIKTLGGGIHHMGPLLRALEIDRSGVAVKRPLGW
jgi:hypothetical protein